jgi:hypothetical protein
VHENHDLLPGFSRVRQLALRPGALSVTQPDVRAATAGSA